MTTLNRIDNARTRIDDLELDSLLITDPSNRRWLSNFTGSTGTILIDRDCALFAADSRYWEQVNEQAPEFTLVKVEGATTGVVPELLSSQAGKRIGFEPASMTVALHESWQESIEEMPLASRPELVPAPDAIEQLRMIKDPDELDALSRAVLIGDKVFEHASAIANPGMTEKELAWEVHRSAMEHGADELSFPTIIASGPWAALPHAYPRNIKLEADQPVVMDLGVRVNSYCSDLTRTIFIGKPDDEFRRIYDIVLTAQMMAEERIEAGMTGMQAHEIAATVIAEAGYGAHFGHGLGHGVGLDVHEEPRLSPSGLRTLEDGHVVTVEPGIYIPGWGGVRIEDQCVMENGRLRSLTTAPKLDLEITVATNERTTRMNTSGNESGDPQ